MEEVKVIFTLDGINLTIQSSNKDKMRVICQKYATKINININSLLFLYGGNQINFELSFQDQANSFDKNNGEMNILVYKNENDIIKCPKCGERIKLNREKLDDIISYNNEIKDTIIGIKLQLENIIQNSPINSINIQLKNINKMLSMIKEDINMNNEKLMNLTIENSIIKNIDFSIKNDGNGIINIKTNDVNKAFKKVNNENNKNVKNQKLLKNIKSKYIIQKIFSNLDEKRKLKTIKYNKNLQDKINIKLINFKLFTGRYIIYDKKKVNSSMVMMMV